MLQWSIPQDRDCVIITEKPATGPAGSVGASQLAQLFSNLGHPLPYDKLTAIMQEYDVSKSGQASIFCCYYLLKGGDMWASSASLADASHVRYAAQCPRSN